MEIKEETSEGLKRKYSILIDSTEIEEKIQEKLNGLTTQVNLPGFRPGKVPKNVIRARFGKSVFGEVIQETVDKVTQDTLKKNNIRPAFQPKIEINKDFEEGKNLQYTVELEILPEIETKDFTDIKLDKMVLKPENKDIDEALDRIASEQRTYETTSEKSVKSKMNDAVIIDFIGKIDNVEFDGGKAEGTQLVLGSGQFIPGFEEQLIGFKAGDATKVKVKFPDDYQNEDLKGKDAVFDVEIKEVKNPKVPKIDDKLATALGLESLKQLKEKVSEQIQNEYNQISRSKLKKVLLDNLDTYFSFDLPPTLVENEFEMIWRQIEEDIKNKKLEDSDKSKTEDELKNEYKDIASRRVRLGLILNDIGQKNDIKVEESELNRAIQSQAQRYPGQEKQIFEFYKSNSQATMQLQAPIFEDKVVDFILKDADVSEIEVSKEELLKVEDDEKKPKNIKKISKTKKNPTSKASKKISKKPAKKLAKKPATKKKVAKKKAVKAKK